MPREVVDFPFLEGTQFQDGCGPEQPDVVLDLVVENSANSEVGTW